MSGNEPLSLSPLSSPRRAAKSGAPPLPPDVFAEHEGGERRHHRHRKEKDKPKASPRVVVVEYDDDNDVAGDAEATTTTAATTTTTTTTTTTATTTTAGTPSESELRERILEDIVLEKLAREQGIEFHSKLKEAAVGVDAKLLRDMRRTLMAEVRAGRKLRKAQEAAATADGGVPASSGRRRHRRQLSKEEQIRRVRDEVVADIKRGHKHRLRRTEHGHKHSRKPKHFGLDDNGNLIKIAVKPQSRAAEDIERHNELKRKELELRKREEELAKKEAAIQKTAEMREREAQLLQRKLDLEERQRKLAERSQKLLEQQGK